MLLQVIGGLKPDKKTPNTNSDPCMHRQDLLLIIPDFSALDKGDFRAPFLATPNCTVRRPSTGLDAVGLANVNFDLILLPVLFGVSYALLLTQLCCLVHYWTKFTKSHLARASCLADLPPAAMNTVKALMAFVVILIVAEFAFGLIASRLPVLAFAYSSDVVLTCSGVNCLSLLTFARYTNCTELFRAIAPSQVR